MLLVRCPCVVWVRPCLRRTIIILRTMPTPDQLTPSKANFCPTAILDFKDLHLSVVAEQLRNSAESDIEFLRASHQVIMRSVRPIYTLNEFQSASETLRKQAGSCSQRLACLEALSRAGNIPTRVNAYWIKGEFWYPRFRKYRLFIPKVLLLAWPEFHVNNCWTSVDEIYSPVTEIFRNSNSGFSNRDSETLFEAIKETPIDFAGKAFSCECRNSELSLSRYVASNAGIFATRDEVFRRFGLFFDTLRGRAFELLFGGKPAT
jgi:hypothetical protein